MKFHTATLLASLSTGTNIIAGLITTKVVAAILGPEGMAYTGQFTNIYNILLLIGSGACLVGVVKYLAQFDEPQRRQLLATSFTYVGACTLLVALACVLFYRKLSQFTFQSEGYGDVFLASGALIFFTSANAFFVSVLNGLQRIRQLTVLGIIHSCISVVAVILLARNYGVKGAVLGTSVAAFITFFFYFSYLRKARIFPAWAQWRQELNPKLMQLLLNFALMSLVSGLIVPSLQFFVRSKLMQDSTFDAGIWQATTRISDYYLNFIYSVLGVYYLPKLSSLQRQPAALRREIWAGYLRIIPAVAVIALCIWLGRELIIRFLLTEEFRPMFALMKWQLPFDLVKISSFLLGYLMLAGAMRNTYIATEIVFSTTFILLNNYFINRFGTIGAVWGYGLNYTLYLITLIIIFRRLLFNRHEEV